MKFDSEVMRCTVNEQYLLNSNAQQVPAGHRSPASMMEWRTCDLEELGYEEQHVARRAA